MYSIKDITTSVKRICSGLATRSRSERSIISNANQVAKNIYVTIIVTESTASILNLKAIHLQDINDNYTKSKISIPFKKSLIELLTHGFSDNAVGTQHNGIDRDKTVSYSRLVQMEPSSTSFYGLDDLSEVNLKPTDKTKNISIVLKPDPVLTQSLMVVHSAAHDDKLDANSDKIMVTVVENELPVTTSGWINVCRICHGGESTEDLIAPCRCKGSVALTHISCLERWLKQSANSNCELCQHHFDIIKEPKYNFLQSLFLWFTTPDAHGPEFIEDLISFCLYTPSAICSTYILMMLCDTAARFNALYRSQATHLVAFLAISGMAAIDFTYSSWLMMTLQRHLSSWRSWFRENSHITVVLPPRKRRKKRPMPNLNQQD